VLYVDNRVNLISGIIFPEIGLQLINQYPFNFSFKENHKKRESLGKLQSVWFIFPSVDRTLRALYLILIQLNVCNVHPPLESHQPNPFC